MHLWSIIIFCLTIVSTSLCYYDNHGGASVNQPHEDIEEMALNFDQMHRIRCQAKKRMFFRDYDGSYDSWFHPVDSIFAGQDTPVYVAARNRKAGNISISLLKDLMKGVGQALADPGDLASVAIGNGERTEPISDSKTPIRKRRSYGGLDNSFDLKHQRSYEKNSVIEPSLERKVSKLNSEIPKILYPQILAFVDYTMYKPFKRNLIGLMEYALAFLNDLDIKFRKFECPKVRLHIAAIVIGIDPEATPYISRHMFNGEQNFDAEKTISTAKNFFRDIAHQFKMDSYDVALTITRNGLKNGSTGKIVGGQSSFSHDCKRATGRTENSIAIVNDDGAFSGVRHAARELGYTFGLVVDYGRSDCTTHDGYIMSDNSRILTTKSSLFSNCSLEKFQEQLDIGQLRCLYNKPPMSKNLPKLVPGVMMNREKQCKSQGKGRPCTHKDHYVCANNYCFDENNNCRATGIPVLDGTLCGHETDAIEGLCILAKCVY